MPEIALGLHTALYATFRSTLTLQVIGHAPRDSPTPWILYPSPTTDYRISLWDVFNGAVIENTAQRALILVRLVREYLPLHLSFPDITFEPTFLAVRVSWNILG